MDRHHDLEAAHVGLQDLGDGDAAVGLQMVLEECDEHTRRSHAGVVQGVGQIGLTILPLTRMCRRRACASPRLEQEQTSKYSAGGGSMPRCRSS